MRFRAGKRCEGTFQDVAALMRKVRPAIGEGGHRADRLNLIVLPLETDDAKCRAHARDFRDERFGHGAAASFFRRAFPGFACDENQMANFDVVAFTAPAGGEEISDETPVAFFGARLGAQQRNLERPVCRTEYFRNAAIFH